MDTTKQDAGGAQRQGDAALYWRAAAAIRAGDIEAGIGGMLDLAWAPSLALRDRARAALAAFGCTVSDDPVCLEAPA